jgi:predicted RecA/RadA family phage recombinase
MTTKWRQKGATVTVVAPGTIENGDFVIIGGIFGLALNGATTGLDVEVITEGQVNLTKATGFVPAAGDPAYWDEADEALNSDSTNPCIGHYAQAALTGDTAAWVQLTPNGAHTVAHVEKLSLFLENGVANTKAQVFVAPYAGKIVGLSYYTMAKPTSSAGTVLLTAQNAGVADATLLNAATFDLEGATENAVTAFTLTGTAASLVMAAGTVAEFFAVANNSDVVAGSGVHIFVTFQRT